MYYRSGTVGHTAS